MIDTTFLLALKCPLSRDLVLYLENLPYKSTETVNSLLPSVLVLNINQTYLPPENIVQQPLHLISIICNYFDTLAFWLSFPRVEFLSVTSCSGHWERTSLNQSLKPKKNQKRKKSATCELHLQPFKLLKFRTFHIFAFWSMTFVFSIHN